MAGRCAGARAGHSARNSLVRFQLPQILVALHSPSGVPASPAGPLVPQSDVLVYIPGPYILGTCRFKSGLCEKPIWVSLEVIAL